MVTTIREGRPFRIVFFGTPAFAVPSLEAVLSSSHRVVGVVTQPDRPSGRGQRTREGPVKQLAVARELPVFQPERLKDSAILDEVRALASDLGVVVAYGKILPESLLSIPAFGLINVHASLLPKYRGAAPIERAVVAGETMTGVTIMRVVRELDAGPMLATSTRPIGPFETSDVVAVDLARLGARLLVETLDRMAHGAVEETPQDDRRATYAPRLQKHEGLIDWNRPAETVHNQVRGLQPWPLAFTYLNDRRYLILQTSPTDHEARESAGTILEAVGERLLVATGSTPLQIFQIQPEGRRPMSVRDFLAGHRLSPGERFCQAGVGPRP